MAEDITAGRVIIEIMANAAEAERGFADAAEATDDLRNSAKRTRTEVNDLGRSERSAGDNAKTMARAEGELSEDLNRARKSADNLSKSEEDLSKQNEKATKSSEELSDAEEEQAANAGKAHGNTKVLTDRVKDLVGPLDDVKSAMGVVTGILGAFGISAGVGILIDQLKDLAAQAEDARKSVEKAYQYIYYTTGDLTEEQMEMYNSILSYNPQTRYKGYAGDPTKVSTAIAMLGQYYPTMSADELQKLVIEQLSLDKLGKGELQSNISSSGKAFAAWGISAEEQADELEYLRTVSQKTLVEFPDLLERMYDLKDFADELGVSFRGLADIIGVEFQNKKTLDELDKFASSYDQDRASVVSDLEKEYEKAYETRFDALEKEYKKALASTSDDLKKDALEKEYKKSVENLKADIHQKAVDAANAAFEEVFTTYTDHVGKFAEDAEKNISAYELGVLNRTSEDTANAIANQANLERSDDFWARFSDRTSAREEKYVQEGFDPSEAQYKTKIDDIVDFILGGIVTPITDIIAPGLKQYVPLDEYGLFNLKFTGNDLLEEANVKQDEANETLKEIAENTSKPSEITINQNFYVPAADPYTVQNAAKQGASAAQSGLYKLG